MPEENVGAFRFSPLGYVVPAHSDVYGGVAKFDDLRRVAHRFDTDSWTRVLATLALQVHRRMHLSWESVEDNRRNINAIAATSVFTAKQIADIQRACPRAPLWLLDERMLHAMLQMAIWHGASRRSSIQDPARRADLGRCVLLMNDLLRVPRRDPGAPEQMTEVEIQAYMLNSLLWGSQSEPIARRLPRFWSIISQSSGDAGRDDEATNRSRVDLDEAFFGACGLHLKDAFAIGFQLLALHVGAMPNGADPVVQEDILSRFSPLIAAEGTVTQFFEAVAADEAQLRDAIEAADGEFSVRPDRWFLLALRRRPLLRLDQGRFRILSPGLLIERMTEGLYHDAANQAGLSGGSTARGRVSSYFGDLFEAYCRRVISGPWRESLVALTSPATVPRPDIVLQTADGVVCVEAKTKRLSQLDFIDTSAHVSGIVEDIVGIAEQLSKGIDALLDGRIRSSPQVPEGALILPVIVTYTRLPLEILLRSRIAAAITDAGWLRQAAVAPVEILHISELELLAGGNRSLAVWIRRKQVDPSHAQRPMIDFLYDTAPEVCDLDDHARGVWKALCYETAAHIWGSEAAERLRAADRTGHSTR